MSDDRKQDCAPMDFPASENARQIAERIGFELGKTTLQERLHAIQSWVGGPSVMSDLTGMSASGIKGWVGRGSQPGILSMVELSRKTGLSLDYIGTGVPRLAADFDCEEARFNGIVSSLRGTTTGLKMRFAGGEIVESMRSAIRRAREGATQSPHPFSSEAGSDAAIATAGKSPLDYDLLRIVIETVEEELQSRARNIIPANKAELVLLAYSIMLDEDDKQQGRDKIIRLARLAG